MSSLPFESISETHWCPLWLSVYHRSNAKGFVWGHTFSKIGDNEYRLRLGLHWAGKPIRKSVTTDVRLILNSHKEKVAVFSFKVQNPKAVILFR